jgi:vacuolar-type H+-ATPase subunit E/Vma4
MAQSIRLDQADEQIDAARKRLEEQKTRMQRLIVQGAPSQAAEDLLRTLHEALQRAVRQARTLR